MTKCAALLPPYLLPPLTPFSPSSFIPLVPYPPLRGTFPSRGRLTIREYRFLKRRRATLVNPSAPLLRHPERSRGIFLARPPYARMRPTQTTPWCFPLSSFPHSRFTGLPKGSLHFDPHDTQERRIVSHPFSYRCVELCLSEALYPAPSARPFSKGLLVSLL